MKGRIKMYNSDRGFGFITGEDGNEYFFHISNVKSMIDVTRGMIVSFSSAVGPKGRVAKDIAVDASAPIKPVFLAVGDERIKISNIKNYSLETVDRAVSPRNLYYLRPFLCLTIVTYQGDEFRWWEDSAPFNIREKFNEIDRIMTGY